MPSAADTIAKHLRNIINSGYECPGGLVATSFTPAAIQQFQDALKAYDAEKARAAKDRAKPDEKMVEVVAEYGASMARGFVGRHLETWPAMTQRARQPFRDGAQAVLVKALQMKETADES